MHFAEAELEDPSPEADSEAHSPSRQSNASPGQGEWMSRMLAIRTGRPSRSSGSPGSSPESAGKSLSCAQNASGDAETGMSADRPMGRFSGHGTSLDGYDAFSMRQLPGYEQAQAVPAAEPAALSPPTLMQTEGSVPEGDADAVHQKSKLSRSSAFNPSKPIGRYSQHGTSLGGYSDFSSPSPPPSMQELPAAPAPEVAGPSPQTPAQTEGNVPEGEADTDAPEPVAHQKSKLSRSSAFNPSKPIGRFSEHGTSLGGYAAFSMSQLPGVGQLEPAPASTAGPLPRLQTSANFATASPATASPAAAPSVAPPRVPQGAPPRVSRQYKAIQNSALKEPLLEYNTRYEDGAPASSPSPKGSTKCLGCAACIGAMFCGALGVMYYLYVNVDQLQLA